MDLPAILTYSLWSGLFGLGLAVLLTAPPNRLLAAFVCSFAGRLVRDLFIAWGLGSNWSTVIGAAAVVLIAVAFIPRHQISPVVLICAVLPLAGSVAVFNAIFELMKLSSARGEALHAASMEFASNLAKAFVTSLSIALGISAGLAIAQLFRRKEVVEG
jgi:uncharacterized membrane protein YjjB (DUF3815 family)